MDAQPILPHLNAGLNSLATILLLVGFYFIKTGDRSKHKAVMISAVSVSAVFLISYLIHHFTAPVYRFPGEGWVRPVYFAMLTSHVITATVSTPMIAITFWKALKGNFVSHPKWARWTWPLWLYTTVTGVAIWYVLYIVYAGEGQGTW